MTASPKPVWFPFVTAGLVSTVSVGALSGAFDLWSLRVRLVAIPLEHSRGHALAQLFGFMLLITMGLSLHLVPKFFSAAEVDRGWARQQGWLAIGGLVLLVVGQLGRLVPGSAALGVTGSVALTVAVARWLGWLWAAWAAHRAIDRQGHFLLAGAGWWLVAALGVVGWQIARLGEGPLHGLPLEPVYAAALFGASGSWVFGIMLRAGVCVLRIERPSVPRQRVMFAAWQVVAISQVMAAVAPSSLGPVCALLGAGGATVTLAALKPWVGALPSLPGEPFIRRMVQLALVALAAWAAMQTVRTFTGVSNPMLTDVARHVYTLGFATLAVFGFGGRMVPGFSGSSLVSPRSYTTGSMAVVASLLVRAFELAPARWALALSGSSALLSALGVMLMTGCLLSTLLLKRRGSPVVNSPQLRVTG